MIPAPATGLNRPTDHATNFLMTRANLINEFLQLTNLDQDTSNNPAPQSGLSSLELLDHLNREIRFIEEAIGGTTVANPKWIGSARQMWTALRTAWDHTHDADHIHTISATCAPFASLRCLSVNMEEFKSTAGMIRRYHAHHDDHPLSQVIRTGRSIPSPAQPARNYDHNAPIEDTPEPQRSNPPTEAQDQSPANHDYLVPDPQRTVRNRVPTQFYYPPPPILVPNTVNEDAPTLLKDTRLTRAQGRFTNGGISGFRFSTNATRHETEINDEQCSCNTHEHRCGESSQCINRLLYRECGRHCIGTTCTNRLSSTQNFRSYKITTQGDCGKGVLYEHGDTSHTTDIQSGEILMFYGGTVSTRGESFNNASRGHNISDYGMFAKADKGDNDWTSMYIEGSRKECWATHINHHCAPNVEAIKYRTADGLQRVAIQAIRNIKPMTFLSLDYAWTYNELSTPTRCECGHLGCRGWIEKNVPSQPPSPPHLSGSLP